jgi:hypothetical protein
MRKRLYFDNTVKIRPYEISVLIKNGKIREYYGFNFTNYFVASIIPNPNIQKGDFDYKTVEMNEDFTLSKVGKYDRKKSDINANYKIECHELLQLTFKDVYFRLNFIEKFIIDYAKKESIFHQVKFARKLLILVLLTIPTALFISQFKSCDRNAKNIKIESAPPISSSENKIDITKKNEDSTLISVDQEADSLKCNISIVLETFQCMGNVSGDLTLRFLKTFGENCKNNVEYSEFSNEVLFKLLQSQPEQFCKVIENHKDSIDFSYVIQEIENPLHDLIDLGKTKIRIVELLNDKELKIKFEMALDKAIKRAE